MMSYTCLFESSEGRVAESRRLTVGVELYEVKQQLQMAHQGRLSRTVTLTQ